jgi:hypothetical protein
MTEEIPMTALPPPYPLAWPEHQRRTHTRVKSAFKVEFTTAQKNVLTSLRLFAQDTGTKLEDARITASVGLMGMNAPTDPGIAVWFTWDGDVRCIAVDRYLTVRENLQALHHVLEARRTEFRHAGIEMVRTTFRGFRAALPAPGAAPWWTILGVPPDATVDQIRAAFKARAANWARPAMKPRGPS